MHTYTIMARMTVDVSLDIKAESLADAVAAAAKLNVPNFVRPAVKAEPCFNDYDDFNVYGVCRDAD